MPRHEASVNAGWYRGAPGQQSRRVVPAQADETRPARRPMTYPRPSTGAASGAFGPAADAQARPSAVTPNPRFPDIEHETLDPAGVLDGIERCQQSAPRVSEKGHLVEFEMHAKRFEIGDAVLIAQPRFIRKQLRTQRVAEIEFMRFGVVLAGPRRRTGDRPLKGPVPLLPRGAEDHVEGGTGGAVGEGGTGRGRGGEPRIVELLVAA